MTRQSAADAGPPTKACAGCSKSLLRERFFTPEWAKQSSDAHCKACRAGSFSTAARAVVIVLLGMPGSGKSTFVHALAKHVREERGERAWTVVSQDTLGSRRKCVTALQRAMSSGASAVVDRCNQTAQQRAHWTQIVKPQLELPRGDAVAADAAAEVSPVAVRDVATSDAGTGGTDGATTLGATGAGAEVAEARALTATAAAAAAAAVPAVSVASGDQMAVDDEDASPPFLVAIYLDVPVETCVGRVMRRRGHPTLPPSRQSAGVVRTVATELTVATAAEGFDLVLTTTERKHGAVLSKIFMECRGNARGGR